MAVVVLCEIWKVIRLNNGCGALDHKVHEDCCATWTTPNRKEKEWSPGNGEIIAGEEEKLKSGGR